MQLNLINFFVGNRGGKFFKPKVNGVFLVLWQNRVLLVTHDFDRRAF